MEHRTRSILFISAQLYERKLIQSLWTPGFALSRSKKEIRVSKEEHPIPVRRIKQEGFMSRLQMWQVWAATVVLSTGLAVVPSVAAGNTLTFNGKVSDAMCGATHMEK